MSNSLQIDTNLTYCPTTLTVSQPLTITNISEQQLAFKIKTNKKNFLSMNPCNGFIKPFTNLAIPVKIVEHVPQNVSIKLQVDWCKVTPEMRQKNDIKMATVNQKDIFKKVFPIIRKQASHVTNETKPSTSSSFSQSHKAEKQESKITPFVPFQPEKNETEQKRQQSPKRAIIHQEQQHKEDQSMTDSKQQYRNVNSMLASLSSPAKNLEIVSEEDEEDHEKELQQIRTEQVNQRRLIDELQSKIRKINQEVKSTQIIDPKLLFAALASSFLVGGFLQYLIF